MKKIFIVFLLFGILALTGCPKREQANINLDVIADSSIRIDQNHKAFASAVIADIRTMLRRDVDSKHDAAVKAETKIINGEPSINPTNLQILINRKLEQYQDIENKMAGLYQQTFAVSEDAAVIAATSKKLKEYFIQEQRRGEFIQASLETATNLASDILGKKIAPKAKPGSFLTPEPVK